jgi:hypothetical protein
MGDAEKQSAEEEDDGCGLGHGGCFVYELVCLIDRLTFLATMKLGVCLYRGIGLLGHTSGIVQYRSLSGK